MKNKKIYSTLLSVAIATSLIVPSLNQVSAANLVLSDISQSYAYKEISTLVDAGIINGNGDGTFRPKAEMTRQEFAVVLAKLLKLQPNTAASAKFTDVSDWARPYVGALYDKGITSGIGSNTFGAKDSISREQLAVFFIRAMGYEDVAKQSNLNISFADGDKVAEYAKNSVALASKIGFIKGDGSNFSPKANADRQAVARLAYEMYTNQSIYSTLIKDLTNPVIFSVESTNTLYPSTEIQDNYQLSLIFKDKDGKVINKADLPSDLKITYSDSYGIFKSDGALSNKNKIPSVGVDVPITIHLSSVNSNLTKDYTINYKVTSLVKSVLATGAKTFTVTFDQAVDTSKVYFTVNKGSTNFSVANVVFSSDKKSATFNLTSRFVQGDYVVTIKGIGTQDIARTVTINAEVVAKIELLGSTAAKTDTGATIGYRVYNQYGEDITSLSTTPEIIWTPSVGSAVDNNNGVITLTGTYSYDQKITLTGVESRSTQTVSQTITIGNVASAQTFENIQIYNVNNKTLETSSNFDEFILLFDIKDQYGNQITNVSQLKSELVVLSSDTSILNVDINDLASHFGSNSNHIGIPLKAGSLNKAGTVTLTLLSKTTGAKTYYNVTVVKSAIVDYITLSNPSNVVAVGEDVEIPFTALDQYGSSVTTYNAFTSTTDRVTLLASDGNLRFVNDPVTKKAVLKYTAPTTEKTVILSVVSPTTRQSQITFDIKPAAKPSTIYQVKNVNSAVALTAKTIIKAENVSIFDQYSRVVKLDDAFFAKYKISIKATDGIANNVSLSEQFIDSTSKSIELTGAIKGVETFELAIVDITTNQELNGSSYQFNVKAVDVSDINSYDISAIPTIYNKSSHSIVLNVYGQLYDGTKVSIPNSQYIVTSGLTGLSYENGKLNAEGVVFGTSDGNEKKGTVTIVIEGKDGVVTVEKPVTVSNIAPKTDTITIADSNLVTIKDNVAIVKTENATVSTLMSVFKAKDQYGFEISLDNANISITNIIKSSNSNIVVNNNGSKNASISNAQKDDSFSLTIITTDGKVSTLKVVII